MKFSRRNFIGASLTATASAALMSSKASALTLFQNQNFAVGQFRGAVPIMQGLATKSTSQFVILTDAAIKYGYAAIDSKGGPYSLAITRRESRTFSKFAIEKILVTGLKTNTDYTLQVIDPNTGKPIDERLFKSLDTDLKNPKLMIASCMKDNKEEEREVMWDNVAEAKPDVVFLIGDTCYSDNGNDGSDAGYWRRYCETRSLLSHFRQKRLIPTLAVWDDHDFADNNADGTFAKKEMTKDLFKIFWDNEPQEGAITKGPGVAQLFNAFGQRFFMMDSRFYRSPRGSSNPVQWGEQQEDFLFENISKGAKPSWLMNGSQFFGGYLQKDAFEYWHSENLKSICQRLARIEAPVVFASGDVHFSEYMKIEPEILGYTTYEITSSSIHSTTIAGLHLRKKNPRRIDASSTHQFAIVQTDVNKTGDWTIAAQSFKMGLIKTLEHTATITR
ncbi:MAG: hypothetical protein H7256_14635 [Bdellovibrio sp.]|nr:hypothetical protein [Bdellovibrio sp.]